VIYIINGYNSFVGGLNLILNNHHYLFYQSAQTLRMHEKFQIFLQKYPFCGAVAIDDGTAVRQMDESAGDAFMLIGLGVTRLKAVKQLIRKADG
jgi:hypothetical protein